MSLDDRIFELSAHVEGTEHEADLDAIVSYLNEIDAENDRLREIFGAVAIIQRLEKENQHLRELTRWRDPVIELPEESTPLDIKKVLVKCEWYDTPVIGWYICGEWKVEGSPSKAPVTAWQPFIK
jgi:hypothetical protein